MASGIVAGRKQPEPTVLRVQAGAARRSAAGGSRGLKSKPVAFAPMTAPLPTSGGGKALAGFLLSGFLLALLGAILPVWGYHRDPDFTEVGNYFLSVAVGIVAAALLARPLMERRGISFLLVSACAVSCLALAFLGLVPPPAS